MSTGVRQARERKGWSQQRLAERSGLSLRTIQGIEAGTTPRVDTAVKLARALGIRLDRLFDGQRTA